MRIGARHRARQRGNSFVELSLVLVPLMALVIAIIDFALPIFLRSVFTHAAREGVRYGITYQTVAGRTHSESIRQIVQQHALGFLNGSQGAARIKVRFFSPVTFSELTGPNANDSGNILEVAVEGYQWGWIAPLWRQTTPITINVRCSDRLEVLPRSIPRPAP